MRVNKCMTGMIFCVDDKSNTATSRTGVEKHYYLIINNCESTDGSVNLLQAMSITSMRNKNVTMEVPILLENGYISYIVPYNIHSLHWDDLKVENYKGCLSSNARYSRDEFIQFLKNIYTDSIGNCSISHDELMTQYEDYCTKFFNKYNREKEYRNKIYHRVVNPENMQYAKQPQYRNDNSRLFDYHYIDRDVREWDDNLLLQYYNMVLNNLSNTEYLVKATGFMTSQFAIKKFYHVRREIEYRGLTPVSKSQKTNRYNQNRYDNYSDRRKDFRLTGGRP